MFAAVLTRSVPFTFVPDLAILLTDLLKRDGNDELHTRSHFSRGIVHYRRDISVDTTRRGRHSVGNNPQASN
jgi:hypothetical protein